VTSELLYDVQDKIAHIQINRPKQLNSINPPLMAELSALFRRADEDAGVHVIALEGLQTTKASINRGAEIAGLRQAIDYGVEAGAALDATATETNRRFDEIRAREGLPAAIRWRESQFE
jgi:enoyl-CoA hydratase/carnithine racemase